MGQEVTQGILMGLCAVVTVVLIGVFVTMGDVMLLVGSGIAAGIGLALWFAFRSREGKLAD